MMGYLFRGPLAAPSNTKCEESRRDEELLRGAKSPTALSHICCWDTGPRTFLTPPSSGKKGNREGKEAPC